MQHLEIVNINDSTTEIETNQPDLTMVCETKWTYISTKHILVIISRKENVVKSWRSLYLC